MLRLYFMRQRELLGDLARLAYETIKELMANVFQQLVFEKSSKGGGACGVA